jgi:hypothetical protein
MQRWLSKRNSGRYDLLIVFMHQVMTMEHAFQSVRVGIMLFFGHNLLHSRPRRVSRSDTDCFARSEPYHVLQPCCLVRKDLTPFASPRKHLEINKMDVDQMHTCDVAVTDTVLEDPCFICVECGPRQYPVLNIGPAGATNNPVITNTLKPKAPSDVRLYGWKYIP